MDESAKLALFEQRIVPHLPAAWNLARWIVRNAQDAEDVVQESYIKAFRYFEGFQGTDGRAWLLAIVRNTSLTWLRGHRSAALAESFDERVHAGDVKSGAKDAEEALVAAADVELLRGCIEALPPEYREAVVMREMEELSYKEIAEVASVPIGTVMSRIARARKRLDDCVTRRAKAQARKI